MLNLLIADFQIYYQNLRGFHWNIQGRDFFELHVKFGELFHDSSIKIDKIAERVLAIGGIPLHSFDDYISQANIKAVTNINDGETAVRTIVSNLNSIVERERNVQEFAEKIGDTGTVELVCAFIEEQEKTLWMYNAWLQ